MVAKIIILSVLLVFFALSFMMLVNLPNYIVGTNYEILVHVIWFLGFSVAFAKVGLGR